MRHPRRALSILSFSLLIPMSACSTVTIGRSNESGGNAVNSSVRDGTISTTDAPTTNATPSAAPTTNLDPDSEADDTTGDADVAGDAGDLGGASTTAVGATGRQDLGGFEVTPPSLETCRGTKQCGTVTVPIDTDELSLGTIEIAIMVSPARVPSERIGILMVNPGGPGASGIDFADQVSNGGASPEVLDRFDIVGFDPRGVAASEPDFNCGSDAEWIQRELDLDGVVDTEDEIAVAREAVQACIDAMGPAATRLGTEYVVRDMDVIRAALGEEEMNYYGASYGSTIGMWYASRFPNRVRAMVVDGADNPVDDLSTDQAAIDSTVEELIDLENALREALEACDTPSCPIYNDGDPVGFFLDNVDQLYLVDEQFGGKPTAGSLAVLTTLYNEDYWPYLWSGMAAISQGDPTPLVPLADAQLQGEEGPSITGHINCLDGWGSHPELTEADELRRAPLVDAELRKQMPLITALPWMDVPDFCAFFKPEMPEPGGALDGGDVPIVVIANTSDPVTPFRESIEMAEQQLSNGYVVEVDYPAHVVYGRDRCVDDIVDAVLVDDTLPADDYTVCE